MSIGLILAVVVISCIALIAMLASMAGQLQAKSDESKSSAQTAQEAAHAVAEVSNDVESAADTDLRDRLREQSGIPSLRLGGGNQGDEPGH